VINYDFPLETEAYVHRTGRTGRAGRTGTAISLITPRDVGTLYFLRLQFKIRPLEKQLPTPGELKTRAEADLITMLAEAYAPKGTNPEDLALARRLLSHDRGEEIVAGLLREHLAANPRLPDSATIARRARIAQQPPVPRARAGSSEPDARVPRARPGSTEPDARVPRARAGSSEPDAPVPRARAGSSEPDARVPRARAGSSEPDARVPRARAGSS